MLSFFLAFSDVLLYNRQEMNTDRLIQFLVFLIAVPVVLTLHEYAHARVAVWCGDLTPKLNGRLTLNPLRHFDPLGLICMVLVGFGWAKPVPINPYNFKKYRTGLALTASAGVIVNYITAFLVYPLYLCIFFYMPNIPFLTDLLRKIFSALFTLSLWFCVFNLLPLYPLDGFRIVDALDRRGTAVTRFLRNYGHIILLGLIVESFICDIFVNFFDVYVMSQFDLLGYVQWFALNIVGYPITAFWGLMPW